MSIQNPAEIKEKIMQVLMIRGPSIPVHIAKEIGQSILFTSAFLSELFSEKKIKQSNLRIGNSPAYFIQGQEFMLEKFSYHLKSREKDAFTLLKEKKFLIDEEQEPAIRVALRAIKDFAVPFQKNNKLIWRYFKIPENEFILKKEITVSESSDESRVLDIFDKKQEIKTESKISTLTSKKKSASRKKTSPESTRATDTARERRRYYPRKGPGSRPGPPS